MWLHVISDGLITLSYYCIPIVLIYFIRKNRDLPFNRIFWMFGTFILACGTTHLIEIWNVWHGSYLLAGVVKGITAAVSVMTATMLIPLVPQVISVPGRIHLQEVNRKLEREIAERKRLDPTHKPKLSQTALGMLVAVGLPVLVLLSVGRKDYPDMDTILDTCMFLLAGVLALLFWDIGARGDRPFPKWVAVSFAVTSLSEFVHTLTSLEGSGALTPFVQAAGVWRPFTWPAAAHLLPIGIGCAIWLMRAGGQRVMGFALAMITLAGGLFVVFHWLPRYTSPTWLGITCPTLILVPLLWALVALACWRLRSSDRMFSTLALMAVVLLLGNVSMLYSRTPHDPQAMVAHLGRVGGYLVLLLSLMQMASFDMLERIRSERELAQLNAELERRVVDRTARLDSANKSLEAEIAVRQETERAQRKSQQLIQAIIDNSAAVIYVKDLQGRYLMVNRRYSELFHISNEEIAGKTDHDLFPKEVAEAVRRTDMRVAAAATARTEEEVVPHDDGPHTYISVKCPLWDDTGKPYAVFGISTDITDRKHAEEAIRASEERTRLIVETALDAVITMDAGGVITDWSPQADAIFGWTREEVLGRSLAETIIPHKYREAHRRGLNHCLATGQSPVLNKRIELIALHRDGHEFPVELSITPIRTGDIQVFSAFVRDVTDRKRAEQALAAQAEEMIRSEQALRAQTRMFRSVLDSMDEGLITTDEHGQFLLWNPAAERILGKGPMNVPLQEWAGHYGLYLPDGVTPFPADQLPLVRAMRGEANDVEMFIRNPKLGEGVWIEATGRPLKDESGIPRGGVVAFRDVTQTKAKEREIRQLNDELEERVAQRTAQLEEANQELEAFTYSVSHDLRAPLRHMAGFSGLLLEEFGSTLDSQGQHYVRRIQEGTRKMGQLVDELLSLARVGRQSPNLQVAGLNSIVEEVVAMLEPECDGRDVEWKIARLPSVACDPTLMKQVFQNLLSNALKYSRPRQRAVIEVGSTQANGQAAIFVRDNGVGFNMKYSDKLFGVFQRLHRPEDFEGTGVGLATVQRIIKKHGGRIWAEAELDKGATFYFTVEVAAPAEHKSITATAGTGV